MKEIQPEGRRISRRSVSVGGYSRVVQLEGRRFSRMRGVSVREYEREVQAEKRRISRRRGVSVGGYA